MATCHSNQPQPQPPPPPYNIILNNHPHDHPSLRFPELRTATSVIRAVRDLRKPPYTLSVTSYHINTWISIHKIVTILKSKICDGMAPGQEIDDSSNTPSSPKKVYKDPDDGRQRFLLELEFVQCLANPTYIHYLAQNRYFEDEAFIGYLKYLQYWQRPEYIKFIMYPHCLYFLELLQNASFRTAMAHPANKELTHRQQFYFWKNYRNNRLKHILPRPLPEPTPVPPSNALPPPPPITMAASSVSVSAPSPVLSPMQYGVPPGPPLPKNDPRSGLDRRKRKKDG